MRLSHGFSQSAYREQHFDCLACNVAAQHRAGIDIFVGGDARLDDDVAGRSWVSYATERIAGIGRPRVEVPPAHFMADMRPQMVSYACLGGLLLILERDRSVPGSRARWLLPPLMLLWVNFHAAFMAGVSVLLATLVGDAVEAWLSSRGRLGGEPGAESGASLLSSALPRPPRWKRLKDALLASRSSPPSPRAPTGTPPTWRSHAAGASLRPCRSTPNATRKISRTKPRRSIISASCGLRGA